MFEPEIIPSVAATACRTKRVLIHNGARTTRRSEVVEAFFLRHRDKLVWVHAAMFVLFLAVIVVPLFLPDPPETATPWRFAPSLASTARPLMAPGLALVDTR